MDDRVDTRGFLAGTLTAVLGAVAILVLGGARQNFTPVDPPAVDANRALPELIEPQEIVPSPPTEFRWRPSGPDVEQSQVLLYRADLTRLWSSGPLRDSTLTVPLEVYDGVGAGESCYWRVREVAKGRPLATSALMYFYFEVDLHGHGVGETQAAYEYID
jgi:hypothetical protein